MQTGTFTKMCTKDLGGHMCGEAFDLFNLFFLDLYESS